MADIYPRNSAVVYRTVVDNILEMKNEPEIQRKFALAYLQYLMYGHHDYEDDTVIHGLMKQPGILADQSAVRYDKAKVDGASGGAVTKGKRERWTNEDVYQYYKVENHDLEETAKHFGYSKRTVQDKCKKYIDSVRQNVEAEIKETDKADVVEVPMQVNGEWRF